jgi:hypothetical protein
MQDTHSPSQSHHNKGEYLHIHAARDLCVSDKGSVLLLLPQTICMTHQVSVPCPTRVEAESYKGACARQGLCRTHQKPVHDLTKSRNSGHAGNAQAVAQERVVHSQGACMVRCRKCCHTLLCRWLHCARALHCCRKQACNFKEVCIAATATCHTGRSDATETKKFLSRNVFYRC